MSENNMHRRDLVKNLAALGAASMAPAAVAAPAVVTQASVQWRLVSSYPKSLDTIYGAA